MTCEKLLGCTSRRSFGSWSLMVASLSLFRSSCKRCGHAHLLHPAPGLGHVLEGGVKFAVPENIHGQHPTIGQRYRLGLRANLHRPEVVGRMLVQHSPASTLPDADDAMIQQSAAAQTAPVGDEQGHLYRPH